MKTKLACGLLALLVILGCGGAGAPYVPDFGNTTGGNFSIGGGGSQTVNPGQSAIFNMQIMLGQQVYTADRSPAPVSLSVSGLPTDSTASFSANPVTPTDPATDVTMTVATQASTPVGTYPLTVTGDDGQLRQTATFTLVVSPVEADFGLTIETEDGNMTNQPDPQGGKIKLTPDDSSARYSVFVLPPGGYSGQVRVEYRFVEAGAPTAQDIGAQFSAGAASNSGSFTFNITAGTNPGAVTCDLSRLRAPIPSGLFTIEFKIVPLVAQFNSATATARLDIFDNVNIGQRNR